MVPVPRTLAQTLRFDDHPACGPITVLLLASLWILAFVASASAESTGRNRLPDHLWASDARWSDGFAVPEPDDVVLAIETFGEELLIGGRFRQIGTVETPGLARWDGRVWCAFSSGPRDPVTSLLVEGPSLTIAGVPDAAGAYAAVTQWNGHSWSRLGGEEFRGVITRLLRWNGDLIAAGELEFPGRGTHALARLKDGQWLPLGPVVDSRLVDVRDASAFRGEVIIAGAFRSSINAPSRGLLRLRPDEASFDTLANTPGAIAVRARSLALHAGELFVAGTFVLAADPPGSEHVLVAWNGDVWRALDHGPFRSITALRSTASGLLAGGHTGPNGSGQTLVGRLGPEGWTTAPGLDGTAINSLAEWRDQIVAGGDRQTLVLNHPFESGSRRLALHDVSGWHSVTPRRREAAGLEWAEVRALLPHDDGLVATGDFGLTWDGEAWRRAGPAVRLVNHQWLPVGQLSGTGRALAWYQDELYAAGAFRLPSGELAGLARFDGNEWSAVPGSREARALAVYDGRLVVAGRFTPPYNAQLPGIAAFDGTTWSVIGPGPWPPDSLSSINAMLAHRGILYVAGCSINIPGVDALSIARWDGMQWTALGSGVGECLTALAGYGEGIAVGGSSGVSIWNGNDWRALPGVPGRIGALASLDSLLFVGRVRTGSQLTGEPADVLTVWDGRHIHSLGSGIEGFATTPRNATVRALAASDGILWVGGFFRRAGEIASWNVAAWRAPRGRGPRTSSPGAVDISVTPNPCPQGQRFEFALPATNDAWIGIFDLAGRRVRSIQASAWESGARVTWDGRDAEGRETPAGIYVARLSSGDKVIATRRLVRLP